MSRTRAAEDTSLGPVQVPDFVVFGMEREALYTPGTLCTHEEPAPSHVREEAGSV
ncbi:hypothetical protein [Paenibacillus dendritiformis]|uniref:hypothetical protein n=1 Tax=Paenibacillus dendritiformis TaxID=130049 RepID=UPI0018CED486|nr:hypothetical protein [Paenibacillus dendritiformis]